MLIQSDERMETRETTSFMVGVIEGFYGQPWTMAERFELFGWMARWGLNTYLYAPKDDLNHRALWRQLYSPSEAKTLGQLIEACQQSQIRFIYALSPGLDIRYSNEDELDHLKKRFEQMNGLGCQHFSLFFDDIPDGLETEDTGRLGSLASAQCHVANSLFKWILGRCPDARFLFCPTAYCGRMADGKLGGEGYLATIGRELLREIDIFWTGPEIISREITVNHVQALREVLRRKPLIWDNLHANDYDGHRFFCGPYSGRAPELRAEVSGLMCNPNTEFPLNYVPLRTLAEFARCRGAWDARAAYLAAIQEWLPYFETVGRQVTLEDLICFGDCYYLPYEEGPEGRSLYASARSLLAQNPSEWGDQAALFQARAARLRDFCVRLSELRQRPLFYALNRRLWELREELDLLDRYVRMKSENPSPGILGSSDFHLPGTYRGGIVAGLQGLLVQQANGGFAPTHAA